MPDDERVTMTPEQMQELLAKLDEVMAEAGRLRTEITRQMEEQHDREQQRLSPQRKRPGRARKRR